jgi:pimeloyl-ACP methyl ester carboxylesterase
MLIEYVELTTSDGIKLPAAYFAPFGVPASKAIDSLLLNPGTSGSFNNPPCFQLAKMLSERGYGTLSIGTRGRDIVWRSPGKPGFYGAAYEDLDECRLDFSAGLDFLRDLGFKATALGGHSQGGAKALYYAENERHPILAAAISLSGPRFSASYYRASEDAAEFEKNLAKAQALVDAGTPDALFAQDYPKKGTLRSARGYIEKYGGETFNVVAGCDKITVPLLRIVGELETGVVQREIGEDLMRMAVHSPHRRALVVPSGEHSYSPSVLQLVEEAIATWLAELPG